MDEQPMDVLRETDAEAVALARSLLRGARQGAIAVLDPHSGAPNASRVAVASDHDGAPLILVSALSAHTAGLVADPRCSLLLGEPGKGDPLAHARISIAGIARRIERSDLSYGRVRWRFLNRNPKARLYADLGDFSFFRIDPQGASLNAGFGKAYALTAAQLLQSGPAVDAIATSEQAAVSHMNEDHADAVRRYARHFGKSRDDRDWVMSGIDMEGFDLVAGDHTLRILFPAPLETAQDVHRVLVAMAIEARQAEARIGPTVGEDLTNRETSS